MEVEIMGSNEKEAMKLYDQLRQHDSAESKRLSIDLEDFASLGLNQRLQVPKD